MNKRNGVNVRECVSPLLNYATITGPVELNILTVANIIIGTTMGLLPFQGFLQF